MPPDPCRRLYRDDSFLTRFRARVVAAEPLPDRRAAIELDRTAFYPTGGGQPHDTGRLGGMAVIDVTEAGSGRILHIVHAPTAEPLPAGEIDGEIDWERRFDHMQQHSGQHILSRAFVEVAGAATRSFHLGESACTIDIDLDGPTEETIRAAERRANDIVFGDAPVARKAVPCGPERARELALAPGEPIRIIAIGDFDETPCGGTHVERSGQVGAVAVRGFERFKGGARVTFVCGGRVVKEAARLARSMDECGALLSATPEALPQALGRLRDQLAAARQETKILGEALAEADATALQRECRPAGSCRVAVRVFAGRTPGQVQRVAQRLTAADGRVALLATIEEAEGRASLIFARSGSGVPGDPRMGDLLSRICVARGGKGGGSPLMARGGGLSERDAAEALEEAYAAIRDLAGSR